MSETKSADTSAPPVAKKPPKVYVKSAAAQERERARQRERHEESVRRQEQREVEHAALLLKEAERKSAEAAAENPVIKMDEKNRAKVFAWMRTCPYDDAIQQILREEGLDDVSREQLSEFFQYEAQEHWDVRIERAAVEANALLHAVEKNPTKFSAGILAALGQEAFRQIASGEVTPEAMAKMTNLFLKARGDERADESLELRREKARFELRTSTEKALEAFAREVGENPGARAALEQLRRELLGDWEPDQRPKEPKDQNL